MTLQKFFSLSVVFILFLAFPIVAYAIPEITGSVETEFGTYIPYQVNVKPDVKPYTVAPDLSNVANKAKFKFTDKEFAMMAKNGFVANHSNFKQVYDMYNYCQKNEIPIFVTTDSMLHTYHVLFDYSLRILEMREFFDDLHDLNKVMLDMAKSQYKGATDPKAKVAATKNLAYVAVASYLLDPSIAVPQEVKGLVDSEIKLIQAHTGRANSPIFGYEEDYSQYVPRGHYTRNETLKKYFMTMMWYGRMSFRLSPREGEEKGKEETLQAILIVSAIKNASALDVWDRIYQPTVFYVGKADDLNVYEYMKLAEDTYGNDFELLSPDKLGDDVKLSVFIDDAKKLRNPLINSTFLWEGEDLAKVTKGFRFMGQRFIPDSYMFQQLVHDKVIGRYFPKGLDIMAVLGSQKAYDILIKIYNESNYPKYTEQMAKLRTEFGSVDTELWAQNLYWNWLYTLMPFLTEKGKGYPFFMQSPAWADKELSTALGSWTELRHDTILYAKQSYAFETAMPAGPQLVKGYVEPNAEFYARLASLSRFTREGLESRGLLLPEFKSRFMELEDLLVTLKEISELELTNQALTAEQYGTIINIGKTLEDIASFPPELASEIEGEEDKEMAVVADVHTDPNSASVLEEGAGYPLNLFVVVPVNGELRISQGPMFSYYEFTWPMSDRLTDAAWQNMLKENPPKLPVWMDSYIDLASQVVPLNYFSFELDIAWQPAEIDVSIQPEIIEVGMQIEVKVTVFGSFSTNPIATLTQGDVTIKQEMKQLPLMFPGEAYTATFDTKSLKPGTALLSVKGQIGEEEFNKTSQIILARPNAVEGLDETSSESKNHLKLKNSLRQSYPNPFNPDVWIPYEIEKSANVTIEIYDVTGKMVRILDLGSKNPGRYLENSKAAYWDGRNSSGELVSSGIYFYKLQAGDFVSTGRMIAIK